jgi:hypothetical protein
VQHNWRKGFKIYGKICNFFVFFLQVISKQICEIKFSICLENPSKCSSSYRIFSKIAPVSNIASLWQEVEKIAPGDILEKMRYNELIFSKFCYTKEWPKKWLNISLLSSCRFFITRGSLFFNFLKLNCKFMGGTNQCVGKRVSGK